VYVPVFSLKVYENCPFGRISPELNIPVLFPIVLIAWVVLSSFIQKMPVPGSTTSVWGVKPALVIRIFVTPLAAVTFGVTFTGAVVAVVVTVVAGVVTVVAILVCTGVGTVVCRVVMVTTGVATVVASVAGAVVAVAFCAEEGTV